MLPTRYVAAASRPAPHHTCLRCSLETPGRARHTSTWATPRAPARRRPQRTHGSDVSGTPFTGDRVIATAPVLRDGVEAADRARFALRRELFPSRNRRERRKEERRVAATKAEPDEAEEGNAIIAEWLARAEVAKDEGYVGVVAERRAETHTRAPVKNPSDSIVSPRLAGNYLGRKHWTALAQERPVMEAEQEGKKERERDLAGEQVSTASSASAEEKHTQLVRKHWAALPPEQLMRIEHTKIERKYTRMQRFGALAALTEAEPLPLVRKIWISQAEQWTTSEEEEERRDGMDLLALIEAHVSMPAEVAMDGRREAGQKSQLFIPHPDQTPIPAPGDNSDSVYQELVKAGLARTPRSSLALGTRPMALGGLTPRPSQLARLQTRPLPGPRDARAYHASHRHPAQLATVDNEASELPPHLLPSPSAPRENANGIRAQLRRWQAEHGQDECTAEDANFGPDTNPGELSNDLARLPDRNAVVRDTQADADEEAQAAMASFMQAPADEPGSDETDVRFLKMGDLVEVEFLTSDTPAIVAVFVRRIGVGGYVQLYTSQGRWLHIREKSLQYDIPGWASDELIKPMLPYLPATDYSIDEIIEESYYKDFSVPRDVAAPLVSKMIAFDAEAKEVYRQHAGRLDDAHNLLAHETDLRYGSLVSAATALLEQPAKKVTAAALFAVRQALSHAGFAFNMDRRHHRLTGYLQIRSKQQFKMVENVRGWLREWQEDLALTATLTPAQRGKRQASKGAQYVYSFLDKAITIVKKSREDREPTLWGGLGPSQIKRPITPGQDSVRVFQEAVFTRQDSDIVQFLEAWSLSAQFVGLPRLAALPPLLLQATGLYDLQSWSGRRSVPGTGDPGAKRDEDRLPRGVFDLWQSTGMLFLQEIGTVLPYENRVRFDQQLLLPSSQHSIPLQNLMSSLLTMQNTHGFKDSMADLRHDWGSLPVFCIDGAGAQEIDDGVSVEPASAGTDGAKEWWVHIHIANPTAFFERDHPLAKMARHMGETIYMPERTYKMMPRWSSKDHFSLEKDRPCLTFSARMDEQGRIVDKRIRSGVVRKVLSLTAGEVAGILGVDQETPERRTEMVLTVGGDVPPEPPRKSQVADVTPEMIEQLRVLAMLGRKRNDERMAKGGIYYDAGRPDVSVWQSYRNPGLAWTTTYRRGWQRVEGDPVIQMKTQGWQNWFSPHQKTVQLLVREMMLLASEIAATWCEERAIPAVFRGTVPRPGMMATAQFIKEVIEPAPKDADGAMPMHIGMQYIGTMGSSILSTTPIKHSVLGMDHYGKVTSPLRRYGDMILHWQIEAAMREEARIRRSLVTNKPMGELNRSFLPFSQAVLSTILVGLKPRENIIASAKRNAQVYWIAQLLFRAIHFGEMELPFTTVRAFIHSSISSSRFTDVGCILMDLNFGTTMRRPIVSGKPVDVRQGDIWECEIEGVDVFRRAAVLRGVRLLERPDVEGSGPLNLR
ncbi:3'-5' RNA exonuclease complex component [Teratosphaeriaceae sp. CCFEE 6253]|nr:3'-5' RNA exonuclease complex component [Teratosphaeriaceae sp. CCFEE 6253]